MHKINIDEIIDRTKLILNAKSDIDLSKKLGKSDTYIGQCRKRKSIDFDLLFDILTDYDFDWLITGIARRQSLIVTLDPKGNRTEIDAHSPNNSALPIVFEDDFIKRGRALLDETNIANESLMKYLKEKEQDMQEMSRSMMQLQRLLAEYQLRDKK